MLEEAITLVEDLLYQVFLIIVWFFYERLVKRNENTQPIDQENLPHNLSAEKETEHQYTDMASMEDFSVTSDRFRHFVLPVLPSYYDRYYDEDVAGLDRHADRPLSPISEVSDSCENEEDYNDNNDELVANNLEDLDNNGVYDDFELTTDAFEKLENDIENDTNNDVLDTTKSDEKPAEITRIQSQNLGSSKVNMKQKLQNDIENDTNNDIPDTKSGGKPAEITSIQSKNFGSPKIPVTQNRTTCRPPVERAKPAQTQHLLTVPEEVQSVTGGSNRPVSPRTYLWASRYEQILEHQRREWLFPEPEEKVHKDEKLDEEENATIIAHEERQKLDNKASKIGKNSANFVPGGALPLPRRDSTDLWRNRNFQEQERTVALSRHYDVIVEQYRDQLRKKGAEESSALKRSKSVDETGDIRDSKDEEAFEVEVVKKPELKGEQYKSADIQIDSLNRRRWAMSKRGASVDIGVLDSLTTMLTDHDRNSPLLEQVDETGSEIQPGDSDNAGFNGIRDAAHDDQRSPLPKELAGVKVDLQAGDINKRSINENHANQNSPSLTKIAVTQSEEVPVMVNNKQVVKANEINETNNDKYKEQPIGIPRETVITSDENILAKNQAVIQSSSQIKKMLIRVPSESDRIQNENIVVNQNSAKEQSTGILSQAVITAGNNKVVNNNEAVDDSNCQNEEKSVRIPSDILVIPNENVVVNQNSEQTEDYPVKVPSETELKGKVGSKEANVVLDLSEARMIHEMSARDEGNNVQASSEHSEAEPILLAKRLTQAESDSEIDQVTSRQKQINEFATKPEQLILSHLSVNEADIGQTSDEVVIDQVASDQVAIDQTPKLCQAECVFVGISLENIREEIEPTQQHCESPIELGLHREDTMDFHVSLNMNTVPIERKTAPVALERVGNVEALKSTSADAVLTVSTCRGEDDSCFNRLPKQVAQPAQWHGGMSLVAEKAARLPNYKSRRAEILDVQQAVLNQSKPGTKILVVICNKKMDDRNLRKDEQLEKRASGSMDTSKFQLLGGAAVQQNAPVKTSRTEQRGNQGDKRTRLSASEQNNSDAKYVFDERNVPRKQTSTYSLTNGQVATRNKPGFEKEKRPQQGDPRDRQTQGLIDQLIYQVMGAVSQRGEIGSLESSRLTERYNFRKQAGEANAERRRVSVPVQITGLPLSGRIVVSEEEKLTSPPTSPWRRRPKLTTTSKNLSVTVTINNLDESGVGSTAASSAAGEKTISFTVISPDKVSDAELRSQVESAIKDTMGAVVLVEAERELEFEEQAGSIKTRRYRKKNQDTNGNIPLAARRRSTPLQRRIQSTQSAAQSTTSLTSSRSSASPADESVTVIGDSYARLRRSQSWGELRSTTKPSESGWARQALQKRVTDLNATDSDTLAAAYLETDIDSGNSRKAFPLLETNMDDVYDSINESKKVISKSAGDLLNAGAAARARRGQENKQRLRGAPSSYPVLENIGQGGSNPRVRYRNKKSRGERNERRQQYIISQVERRENRRHSSTSVGSNYDQLITDTGGDTSSCSPASERPNSSVSDSLIGSGAGTIDRPSRVVCRKSQCGKVVSYETAKATFKSCHNCFAYYCSRACRLSDWEKHKQYCVVSSANSLCKRVIRQIHDSTTLLESLSRKARTHYLTEGRGCLCLAFQSCEKAANFIERTNSDRSFDSKSSLVDYSYSTLKSLAENDQTYREELYTMCKTYDPENRFIIEVSVGVHGVELASTPRPLLYGKFVTKSSKMRLLLNRMNSTGRSRTADELSGTSAAASTNQCSTLLLTSLPGASQNQPVATETRKQRENYFINVQRKLRSRGVSLRHQYPEVYEQLLSYVSESKSFNPITIYPVDQGTSKRFMCLLTPGFEPDINWVYDPTTISEIGVLQTDIS